MRLNIYSLNDEKLGELTFLGWDRWEQPGFDSGDFSQKQVDFLTEIVESRKLNLSAMEWGTVTLTEAEEKKFRNSL